MTVRDLDASAVLGLLPARPRVLALGEPTHGADRLLEVRNDLFRDLVAQHGYRTVAIESDCMAGRMVDDFVTTGAGSLDEVLARGFSHGFGASAANRELVRWMRAFNEGRPAPDRVRFAGCDAPLEMTGAAGPREALTGLYAYLAARVDADLLPCDAGTLDRLLGADERWTNPAALRDPAQSVGRTPEADRVRLLADDLVALLEAQPPPPATASARDDWDTARLSARTAVGLLRYHSWLADSSPGRMARLVAERDAMMAGNLLALAGRGPVLVFAHNAHLQRDLSSMRMGGAPVHWWSAGAIVAAHLGEQYAFLATAVGTIRHHGVDTPPPDTIEGRLYALASERCLADPRRLDGTLAARESPWFGYAPIDPAHLPRIDGLVFVKDAT